MLMERTFSGLGKIMYLTRILQRAKRCYSGVNDISSDMSGISDLKKSHFPGRAVIFTNHIKFIDKQNCDSLPIFRVLNSRGDVQLLEEYKLDEQTLIRMYRKMVTIKVMDKILYESQRQGRISFYMTNTGEEATQIGSAAATTLEDTIYAQYREAGVLLWRGYPITEFMNQCYGNHKDTSKGRQMPVHYGSKKLNFVTISSPLTTQLPQAVGSAYAFKRSQKKACVICYFGEGAASEGDAHAAFNFAATLECPVVFLCRNNGYAISTPSMEQFKGDGIAARGPAYGINTIRVDGNDVLAMYHATKAAREFCVKEGKPVLIEAMTYRIGHHSTSDDSTAYRSAQEIAQWNLHTPIARFREFLQSVNLWCEEREQKLYNSIQKDVLLAFTNAEKELKPCWKQLFTDVYHIMPKHIRKQMDSMENHVTEFPDHYPLRSFEQLQTE